MGATNISWCDYTFNPWIGCEAVSEGCAHCYARRDFGRKPQWADCWGHPATTVRRRTSAANWRKPLTWNQQAAAAGTRYRVFCASLADVFEDAPGLDAARSDLWALIDQTPHLDWLLLAKRVREAARLAPTSWPRNAWFGFTAENQARLNERAPLALDLKRAFRIPVVFVSLEPLLGPVDLTAVQTDRLKWDVLQGYQYAIRGAGSQANWQAGTAHLDWVIAGGESGPGARPLHPEWMRAVRDQCVAAHVPFHFKQWGEWAPYGQSADADATPLPLARQLWQHPDGRTATGNVRPGAADWVLQQRVGRQCAGHWLDGQEWQQFPEATNG